MYYNDILYECYRKNYLGDKAKLGKVSKTVENIIREKERSTKDKLEILRRKHLFLGMAQSSIKRMSTRSAKTTANPLVKLLFMGMTIKAWMKYAERKRQEWDNLNPAIIRIKFIFSRRNDNLKKQNHYIYPTITTNSKFRPIFPL